MRRRHIAFALLIFSAAMIALCCDRRSDSPAASDTAPSASISAAPGTEPPASRPTTQELLTGPTKRLGLMVMPLSADVPP